MYVCMLVRFLFYLISYVPTYSQYFTYTRLHIRMYTHGTLITLEFINTYMRTVFLLQSASYTPALSQPFSYTYSPSFSYTRFHIRLYVHGIHPTLESIYDYMLTVFLFHSVSYTPACSRYFS